MFGNFSNPEENIKHLGLQEGAVVADFGSGSGHYLRPLSKRVGENGKVYALDIQKPLLTKLEAEMKSDGIHNITFIWGNVEEVGGSKLRSGVLDGAILSNILFQVESKMGFLHEVYRTLRPGGQVLLIDWSESFGGLGPEPKAVVDGETAQKLFSQSGFHFIKQISVGNHHYGMVFQKST